MLDRAFCTLKAVWWLYCCLLSGNSSCSECSSSCCCSRERSCGRWKAAGGRRTPRQLLLRYWRCLGCGLSEPGGSCGLFRGPHSGRCGNHRRELLCHHNSDAAILASAHCRQLHLLWIYRYYAGWKTPFQLFELFEVCPLEASWASLWPFEIFLMKPNRWKWLHHLCLSFFYQCFVLQLFRVLDLEWSGEDLYLWSRSPAPSPLEPPEQKTLWSEEVRNKGRTPDQ